MNEVIKEYCLKVTVKKFEGKFAVLETEDKQNLRWPIKDLPDDIQEGVVVRLVVSTAKTGEEEREKLARTVINNILSN
jgi:hypothetical protein